jgi:hypothetical protein
MPPDRDPQLPRPPADTSGPAAEIVSGLEPVLAGRLTWRDWFALILRHTRGPDGREDPALLRQAVGWILTHADRRVRLHGLRWLRQRPLDSVAAVIELVRERLFEPDEEIQVAASRVIAYRTRVDPGWVLSMLAPDKPAGVRRFASTMLWAVREPGPIKDLADDADEIVRTAVRQNLYRFEPPRPPPPPTTPSTPPDPFDPPH